MRRTELILAIVSLIGIVLSAYLMLSVGLIMLMLAATFLSLFYFIFGFAIFNDIPISQIFSKNVYRHTSFPSIMGAIITGFVPSVAVISVVFIALSWAGSHAATVFGLFLISSLMSVTIMVKGLKESTAVVNIISSILGAISVVLIGIGTIFKIQLWPGATAMLLPGLLLFVPFLIIKVIKLRKPPQGSLYYRRILSRLAIYGIIILFLSYFSNKSFLEFKYRNYPHYIEMVKKSEDNPWDDRLRQEVARERRKIHNID